MICAVDIMDIDLESDLDRDGRGSQTPAMDLRHLRTFAAVARAGSFTAAAADLGCTQSAVSQHVAALEADLGGALLTRRPVALTPAGRRLAAHARHILARVDVARGEVAATGRAAEPLRLAATPLAVGEALVRAIAGQDVVELDVVDGAEAVRLLAAGSVDAALLDGVTAPNGPLLGTEPGLFARHLVREVALEVLLPADHPLAGAGGVDLDVLRDARWLDAPHLRCDPSVVPGAWSPRPPGRVRYQGLDLATVTRLVAEGFGAALLPCGAAPRDVRVVGVPLRRPDVVHRTELLAVPAVAPALDGLITALRGMPDEPPRGGIHDRGHAPRS